MPVTFVTASVSSNLMRTGFTLIELMLVVVIIGLIYTLAIMGMRGLGQSEGQISLMGLPTFLAKNYPHQAVSVVCMNDCSHCEIVVNNDVNMTFEGLFNQPPEVYVPDHRYGTLKIAFASRFDANRQEIPVCYRYDQNAEGFGDRQIIKDDEHIVYFPGGFQEPVALASLDEALRIDETLRQKAAR
jgi:prepilin-type N-terminal cleavage/methylation domain-containing protein